MKYSECNIPETCLYSHVALFRLHNAIPKTTSTKIATTVRVIPMIIRKSEDPWSTGVAKVSDVVLRNIVLDSVIVTPVLKLEIHKM
jgi:hypothetical protein